MSAALDPVARAQSAAVPNAPVTFDAASIKPVPFDSRENIGFRFFPGRFVATNLTLANLIQQAYGIEQRELEGGPGWVYESRFDVTATTNERGSRESEMLMLQSLLSDRFKLRLERQSRSGTVYALAALNPHDLRAPADANARPLVSTWREDGNGVLSYRYDGHNATMADLAKRLSDHVHAPVSDQTGLGGHYDFRISWTLDSAFGGLEPDPNVPTIFTALEKQLGLKLEPAKGPVTTLVIRSVASPSPD
jgi:uncharacterized protein (TIGR03435 family)